MLGIQVVYVTKWYLFKRLRAHFSEYEKSKLTTIHLNPFSLAIPKFLLFGSLKFSSKHSMCSWRLEQKHCKVSYSFLVIEFWYEILRGIFQLNRDLWSGWIEWGSIGYRIYILLYVLFFMMHFSFYLNTLYHRLARVFQDYLFPPSIKFEPYFYVKIRLYCSSIGTDFTMTSISINYNFKSEINNHAFGLWEKCSRETFRTAVVYLPASFNECSCN